MHPAQHTPLLPSPLDAVALIDAKTAAAVGSMSLSWWHAEVAAGRAPRPVIQQTRFTRWRLQDVRSFWERRAGQADDAKAQQVAQQAKTASAAAKAKRQTTEVA